MPPGARAGTAYIEFKGDWSKLDRELATHMRGLSREIDVNADTSGLRGFNRELSKTHKEASRTDRDFVSLGRTVSRTNSNFSLLRNSVQLIKWPALITGAGAAAQGLSALGAGAVGLTSALAPLSGALVALPAMFGALVQGAGAAALAFTGLGDALGAMSDAQAGAGEAAQQSGEQQRAAAETVRTAELSLATAQRSVKFAQEDLTLARADAVRQLEDLQLASKGAATSEKEALLALHEARRALREVRGDPESGLFDRRNALLAVESAEEALAQTRLDAKRIEDDLNRAEREGVRGAPQVVSARRALTDAQRQVAESNRQLAEAQRSATEAMADGGTAATNLQEKMAGLPPTLQEFARFLFELKPRMDGLRETAAAGLFPGLQRGIEHALANFPSLERVIGQTASAMGRLAERTGQFIGREGFGRDFERIGAGNVRLMEHMGSASLHLADALRHVMVAGAPLIDWMGRSINRFSALIEQEAKAGRESGRLADFFGQTRDVMERLTSIGGSLAAVFQEIGQAAAPLGRDILKSLDEGADNLERWAESTQGRNSLRDYFDDAKPAIYETGRLIGDATESFFRMANTPGLTELIRKFRIDLLPVLEKLVMTTTEAFGPKLVGLLVEFGKTLSLFVGASGPLTKFVEFFTAGLRVFNNLLESSPALKGMVVSFASMAAIFKAMKFAGAITGVTTLIGLFKGLRTAAAGATAATGAANIVSGSSMFGGQVATTVGQQGTKLGTRLGTSIGSAAGPIITAMVGSAIAGAWVGSKLDIGQTDIGEKIAEEFDITREHAERLARFMERNPGLGVPEAMEFMAAARKAKLEPFNDAINALAVTTHGSMKSISRDVEENMAKIERSFGEHSQRGKRLLSDNYDAAIDAIRVAMDQGVISTERGNKEIQRILGKQLKLFGVKATEFWAGKPVRSSEGQTGPGFNTGLQQGGLASIVPGYGTGDTVPLSIGGVPVAKVEPREGVFVGNKTMMAALAALNDRFPRLAGYAGGGIVELLGPHNDPAHAGSNQHLHIAMLQGIVALGHKLQKMGWLVGEHPAFGGVGSMHDPDGYHYTRDAIDVNWPTGGATEFAKIMALLPMLGRLAGGRGAPGLTGGSVDLPRFLDKGFAQSGIVAGGLNRISAAIEKVVNRKLTRMGGREGAEPGAAISSDGNVERVFANVAKRLSQSKIASLALGMAGYTESGMQDLAGGDADSAGALQLRASVHPGVDPHDEGLIASLFLNKGFTGRGGANALAASGLPAHLVAQGVQGSFDASGSNYLAQKGPAQAWMRRFGLRAGGLVQMLAGGGPAVNASGARSVELDRLLKKIRTLRGATPRIDELIANAEILSGLQISEAGSDLGRSERAEQVRLNQGLLAHLLSRSTLIGKAMGLAGKGGLRTRLGTELTDLQGITGEGGRILGVKQVLDSLGVTPTSELDSMRADLLAQQVTALQGQLAVMGAQAPMFARLFTKAPFGGVFHDGGVVPGYPGQQRTILAEGGEVVGHPGPVEVTIIVNDGAINPDAIDVRINDRLARIARKSRSRGAVVGMKAGAA